jgi:predicted nucleic acid-binding protein
LYLFDTPVFSYGIRNHSLASLSEPELESGAASFISVQTLEEIMFTAEIRDWGKVKRTGLEKVLSKYALLPIDSDTARICCSLRAKAQKMGRELSTPDAWIMATAMQYRLTLVAHDGDMLVSREFGIELICRR